LTFFGFLRQPLAARCMNEPKIRVVKMTRASTVVTMTSLSVKMYSFWIAKPSAMAPLIMPA